MELHIGQGLDLRWTHLVATPTVDQYFDMVDGSRSYVRANLGSFTDMHQKREVFSN